jgi:hypothetical protein
LRLGYRQIKLSLKDYFDGVSNCVFHLSTLSFPLVWPILLPCSYNIRVHLLGASR